MMSGYNSIAVKDTSGNVAYQYYVEGYVYDTKTKKLIDNATIQLVVNATGQILSEPHTLTLANYAAWTDRDPYETSVKFAAKGYKTQVVQFATLDEHPDVYLQLDDEIPWWQIAIVAGAVIAYTSKTKKVGAFGTSDVMVIFLILGGLIGINVIGKILVKLGLGTGPGEQGVHHEESDPKSEWKPTYWQQYTTYSYAITESTARTYAEKIHNAFTVFQDDFNVIWSVFSSLRTKANVSFLAWVFQKQYSEDLLSFLTDGGGILPWDGLSDTHLNTIINYVNNLPSN